MLLYMVWRVAMLAQRRVRGVNFASPQVDRVSSDRRRIKVPPFVSCCPFPVLQIRVISSPCSPLSMQLELVTHVLVLDVVNTTTIQGLGIRPTYSFASLLLSILTLLLLSSGCPVLSCSVLWCPAVFRPTAHLGGRQ